jgi:hypothetical protein
MGVCQELKRLFNVNLIFYYIKIYFTKRGHVSGNCGSFVRVSLGELSSTWGHFWYLKFNELSKTFHLWSRIAWRFLPNLKLMSFLGFFKNRGGQWRGFFIQIFLKCCTVSIVKNLKGLESNFMKLWEIYEMV